MPFSLKFRSLSSTLVVFLLIYSWRRLCLLLRGLDVWNAMWHRFSGACCFLIILALRCHGGPLCLTDRSPAASMSTLSPSDMALPLSIMHSPSSLCTGPPETLTATSAPPSGTEHSSSDWPLNGGRVRVQLSWLMDGLSDFIWAGGTRRWLQPTDCHFWWLYQSDL